MPKALHNEKEILATVVKDLKNKDLNLGEIAKRNNVSAGWLTKKLKARGIEHNRKQGQQVKASVAELIISRYKAGDTYAVIEKVSGVSHMTIRLLIQKAGLPPRYGKGQARAEAPKPAPATALEAPQRPFVARVRHLALAVLSKLGLA